MAQMQAQQQAAANTWTCACGAKATGKFCPECGAKKPEPKPAGDSWTCACGTVNTGKFCLECGKPKPAETEGWTCTAARSTRASSAWNAASRSPRTSRSTAATSAAGSRRTRSIRRASARNAEIHSTTAISNNYLLRADGCRLHAECNLREERCVHGNPIGIQVPMLRRQNQF